MMVRVIKLPIS